MLAETESLVAAYEFTTLTCIPGNIMYRGTKIQLLDLPGIIEGADSLNLLMFLRSYRQYHCFLHMAWTKHVPKGLACRKPGV